MIPVVNNHHRYILLYSAKAGCTSIRRIYLELHRHEMSEIELSSLNKYHNLNEVHPYDSNKDYSNYTTFMLTRNPYGRIVSAFLDQYAFSRSPAIKRMVAKYSTDSEPNNFLEFLQLLKDIPDSERDGHFQSQAFFAHANRVITHRNTRFKWFKKKSAKTFELHYSEDVSKLNSHLREVYKAIFKAKPDMLDKALSTIEQTRKRNSIAYSKADYPNAALLSTQELDALVFSPKPQDFLTDPRVIELIQTIYQKDFELFGYSTDEIPKKQVSKDRELLPDDFDWKVYQRLNPDFPAEKFYNERSLVRHFLEFGQFELSARAYKVEAPIGFEWEKYLKLHPDLGAAGINSEAAALEHYLIYGLREKRKF